MIFQTLFSCIEDYNAIDDEKLNDHTKAAKDICENKSKCTLRACAQDFNEEDKKCNSSRKTLAFGYRLKNFLLLDYR